MSKIKTTVLLLFIFFSILCFGQDNDPKWKLTFQLDNRFSEIHDSKVTIFGAKIGVQYKKLTRFGVGSSFILNPVYINYFNKKTNEEETNKINFWYLSFFNDWILYKNEKWECFVTEQVGFGRPSFTKEINNDIVSDINLNLFINEVSTQVNYKITPWVGVGAGIGYRNLLNKKSVLNATFDAPIYIAKVILYPGAFFKKQ